MKHLNFLLWTTTTSLLWMAFPVSASITSMEEPDWTISKADLVNSLYSYEPYESSRSSSSGREFRTLFPSLFSSGSSANLQHQQQQRRIQNGPSRPQIKGSYGPPSQYQPIGNNIPKPAGQYGPPPPNYNQPPPSQSRPSTPDEYTGQPPPINPAVGQPMIKLLPGSVPPKLTKFSLEDKKVDGGGGYSFNGGGGPNNIPSITSTSTLTPPGSMFQSNPTPPTLTQQQPGYQNQIPSDVKYSQMSSVDSQTIIWPKQTSSGADLATGANGDETQVRFLVHKPGDESIIRNALLEDGKERNQDVKFIEGPTLRIQRHQKVYLPPKKKTVVYILLKEPQIHTDVEVVGPTEDPVPEVFITYQKSDGVVKTNHYSPEVVKNDKYLSQLKETAQSTMGIGSSHNSSSLQETSSSGTYAGLAATGEQNSHVGPQLSQSQRYYYGLNSFNVDEQQPSASVQSQQKVNAPSINIRPVRGNPTGPVFPRGEEKSPEESKRTITSHSTSNNNHNDHTPISCPQVEKGGHTSVDKAVNPSVS